MIFESNIFQNFDVSLTTNNKTELVFCTFPKILSFFWSIKLFVNEPTIKFMQISKVFFWHFLTFPTSRREFPRSASFRWSHLIRRKSLIAFKNFLWWCRSLRSSPLLEDLWYLWMNQVCWSTEAAAFFRWFVNFESAIKLFTCFSARESSNFREITAMRALDTPAPTMPVVMASIRPQYVDLERDLNCQHLFLSWD